MVEGQPTTPPPAPVPFDPAALARLAAEACDDRKATNIVLIGVSDVSSFCDWLVICSGGSSVQVKAIARSVSARLEQEAECRPLRLEGMQEGRWILLDYGDLIVHVLGNQERRFYDLETFWGHGQVQRHGSLHQTAGS